jgi:hypothetical protein
MPGIHPQWARVRNVVEVDMSVAAAERISAREHRSHFAFMHVLLLLGSYEFERVESVGEVFGWEWSSAGS